MNKKKWIKLGLTVLLAFSLTACGTKDSGNADQSNSAVTMTAEAENAQEALSTYKKLMDQENEILSENTDLWERSIWRLTRVQPCWKTEKTTEIFCWTR